MKRIYKLIKFCFYFSIILAAGAGGVVYYYYLEYQKDLPVMDSLKDYNPPVISEVYAEDGTKIGEFWIERRIVLSPQEIPKIIEQAIIASEDASFFDHSGIDYLGIVRAMIENLRAGAIVQGGSTITQQVVKSFFLTKARTWERKIKEAILAKRLEDSLTKKEILYLYLNQIFLGNRSYGIEAAAQNYFHKPAKELNIAEAAMIVGLAKAPSKFNPLRNFKRAKIRQEYVIQRLYEEGYISQQQMARAKNYPLKIYRAPTDRQFNRRIAPWFVEEVRRMIVEKYGENVPYTHGLQIYTTLDLKAQKAADDAIWKGLSELHKRHGYNGPVKNIPRSEWDKFNIKNHKMMYYDKLEPGAYFPNITNKKIANTKVKIINDKLYRGLVTDVNNKNRTVTVRVGNVTGTIINRDYGWARRRNNNSRGYNGIMYIKSPGKTFHEGDIIEVKVINRDSLKDKVKKNYNEDKVYFSLEQTPQIEGALFSYNPFTGYVKAIVGGKDYSKSEFNRATQAVRQTGSIFKPFLYSAALDKGYRTDTIIEDEPLKIPDGPGRYWTPKNYGGGYRGPMTFRSALIASRNVVSVRIILDIGVEYVTAVLRKLGISTPIVKVYSMSLGSNDMKLMEVARAFGVFPTGGILPDLIFIKKMTDRFGTVLEQSQPKKIKNFEDQIKEGIHGQSALVSDSNTNIDNLRKDLWTDAQTFIKRDHLMLTPFEEIILYGRYLPDGYVMNPKTAYTMVSIMQGIVNYGTGYRAKALGRPVAGKTGTTNDQTDCWFIGYTPDLVAGVWTGYDQARIKVGGGETGGKAAAPIFVYYMKEYLKGTPIAKFNIPKNMKYAELDPPVDVYPGDVSDLFTDTGGSGGADFFADDI